MGCCFLLERIFPTQGSNLCFLDLLHRQADFLPLCQLGSPIIRQYVKLMVGGDSSPYRLSQPSAFMTVGLGFPGGSAGKESACNAGHLGWIPELGRSPAAYQDPPSMGFSRQEYWSGLPLPSLLLPSIFPSIRVFSNESVLCIRWPKYWSFSFSINPSNEYSGLVSFRMDWLDLLAVQGTFKSLFQHFSLKAQHSAYKLNKQVDNIQPRSAPFPILNPSVVP